MSKHCKYCGSYVEIKTHSTRRKYAHCKVCRTVYSK